MVCGKESRELSYLDLEVTSRCETPQAWTMGGDRRRKMLRANQL